MAVIRVNKTKDYTIMSNSHFKDKELSLKAKGLLSLMLSLPDSWCYSINGITSLCKEGDTAIKRTLNELKEFGYLKVTKERTEKGTFSYIYDIFEEKTTRGQKPGVVNPSVVNDRYIKY